MRKWIDIQTTVTDGGLTMTDGGAIVGVPARAVSILVVAEGVAVTMVATKKLFIVKVLHG